MPKRPSCAPTEPPGGNAWLEPGQFVRHPQRPDWGEGQVQSVVGARVTVNFEHAGKVLVNTAVVGLEVIEER
jgi:hypothetical protein